MEELVENVVAGYLERPSFDDVRRAVERAERAANGGRPAPLPRFDEVMDAYCRRIAPADPPPDVARWLLDRAPATLDLEHVYTFVHALSLSDYERLDLAWRLPPRERSRASSLPFLSFGQVVVSMLALLGPGPPEARRALCDSIAAKIGDDPAARHPIVAVFVWLESPPDPACPELATAAALGPAAARRAFAAYGLEPAAAVADLADRIRDSVGLADYETPPPGPPLRVAASAREFVRRRVRRASANGAAYVRWRAAAVAACALAPLGRRGDAALRLGGYTFYDFGFDSD